MEQKYIGKKAVFPIPVHGRPHSTERRLDREEEYRILFRSKVRYFCVRSPGIIIERFGYQELVFGRNVFQIGVAQILIAR